MDGFQEREVETQQGMNFLSLFRDNDPGNEIAEESDTAGKGADDPDHADQHGVNIEIVTDSGTYATQDFVISRTVQAFNFRIGHNFRGFVI